MSDGASLCLRHHSRASTATACKRSSHVSCWDRGANSAISMMRLPIASRAVPVQTIWRRSGPSIDCSHPKRPRSGIWGPQPQQVALKLLKTSEVQPWSNKRCNNETRSKQLFVTRNSMQQPTPSHGCCWTAHAQHLATACQPFQPNNDCKSNLLPYLLSSHYAHSGAPAEAILFSISNHLCPQHKWGWWDLDWAKRIHSSSCAKGNFK